MRLVLFLCLGLVLGCTHLPPRQPTGLTAAEFWKRQAESRVRLASLSAKLRLRYEARKEAVSGKGRLVLELPRNLLLELRDPLGRVQYLVTLDHEVFSAYYPTEKRAYLDKQAGKPYLKQFLGFPFSFRDLAEILTGVLPPAILPGRFDRWEWVGRDGVYRGTGKNGETRVICDIDPDTAALRAATWEGGGETAHVTYDDFFPCCGGESSGRMPGQVSVRLDKVNSKVEVEWEEVTKLDAPKPPEIFKPRLGPDVHQILLP